MLHEAGNRIRSVLVSQLGMGGAPLGNLYTPLEEQTALDTVAAAWEGGVRYFDTAPHYGLGLSESRMGKVLRAYPRDTYALSTKVGRVLVPNPTPTGNDLAAGFAVADDYHRQWDFSRDGVLRSIESSLIRLGVDRIDIVYLHDPENHMGPAISEAAPALSQLRDQGVIGAYGAGMNSTEPLQRLVAETDLDVVMVAGRWTLLDRTALPLLDQCHQAGVAVVAAAPFNSGLLAGDVPNEDARFDYLPAPEDLVGKARALAAECQRRGVLLPEAALQFPLRHPAVVTVVAGMRSPAEAAADVAWAASTLPLDVWAALEELA